MAPSENLTDHGHARRLAGVAWVMLLIFGLTAAIWGIFRYSVEVKQEIDTLAIANSDSLQWALAQLEVEYDQLRIATLQIKVEDRASLREFSRRFDIFYSRVHTVLDGRGFSDVVANSNVKDDVTAVDNFANDTAKIIDSGPGPLIAALPALTKEMEALAPSVREISLQGVREFTAEAKRQRERVFYALVRLAVLTSALLAALSAGLLAMWWLWLYGLRQARSQRVSKARLEAVIGTSLDAVIVVDQKGVVTEFNGAAEKIFGYSHHEAMGRKIGELIIPDHLIAAHEAGMRRYSRTGETRIIGHGLVELEAKRKDGSLFSAELSLSSTRIGPEEYFVSYLRDITARVAAEQELINARDKAMEGQRAKAAFVAVMSHEMRTPLNGLLGTLDILRETQLTKEQRRFVNAMEQAGNILLQHVNDVLDMERLDAGKLSFAHVGFDPGELATQIIEAQRNEAAARGNRLDYEVVGHAPGHVIGDPMRIRQVLLNLVGNAIKFTHQGTIRIEIEYYEAQSEIEFRVIDSGIGISANDAERIFDDFVTLDPDQSRSQTGTGLGLGIARRLVHAMGGTIGVESEPGEGSVFWFSLPANKSVGARPLTAPETSPAHTGGDPVPALEILVVEDNDINRVVLCEMLRRAGHTPFEARTGREGVEAAAKRRFDAILMDLNMPEMNGIEATQTIRSVPGPNQRAAIIAITANILPEARAELEQAGVGLVVPKPISRKSLEKALHDALLPQQRKPAVQVSAPPPSPPEDETIADLAEALGPEKFQQVCEKFVVEGDLHIDTLRKTLDQGDLEAHARIAHKFSGAAALMGLELLHMALKHQENISREGDAEGAQEGYCEITEAWDAAAKRINAIGNSPIAGARAKSD